MWQNLLLNDVPPGPGFVEDWARRNRYLPVAGVDEAGRGCLAGPVVTAAVILPESSSIDGLDDSKVLTERKREALFEVIKHVAVAWAVTESTHQQIDATNILAATLDSMRRSVEQACSGAGLVPGIVIVDGNQTIPGLSFNQRPWVKGDHLSFSCAAASILAKVTRDRLMRAADAQYPGYGFAVHKGYGTAAHMKALSELGPCPIHRRTFEPVRSLIAAGRG